MALLDGIGIGSPSGTTCRREKEFSKQTAVLLLEGGGRDARKPETTHVHHRQADGNGISLNQMGPLKNVFSGTSSRGFRLCEFEPKGLD